MVGWESFCFYLFLITRFVTDTDSAISEGTSEPISKEKSSSSTETLSEKVTGSDLASKASSVPESPINSIEVPGTSKVVEDLG